MKNGEVFSNRDAIFLNLIKKLRQSGFCDIPLNKDRFIERTYISVKENDLFSTKQINQVNFITTSPLQIISLATALIPLLNMMMQSALMDQTCNVKLSHFYIHKNQLLVQD